MASPVRSLARYLIVGGVVAVLVNVAINAAVGNAIYGRVAAVPLTGDSSIAGDMIIGAFLIVFFTLLLVTGNTMAIAVRERTSELAVLKVLGYTSRFVLGLVLAESMAIAATGGAFGLWLARVVTDQDLTQGLILLYLPLGALALGEAIALVTGLLAGLLPAVYAMRLNVAAALRRV